MSFSIKKFLFAVVAISLVSTASAQTFFSGTEPLSFEFLAKISPQYTLGNYPIINFGQPLSLVDVTKSESSGIVVPMGSVTLMDVRSNKFYAGYNIRANLGENSAMSNWNDEPCKRDDFIWKNSAGGKFRDVNCVTISHITNYYVSPTGKFQQIFALAREKGIEIPPTIVRATFTRYGSRGRWLVYQVDVNPESYGVTRDSEPVWGANSWHKAFYQKDPRKVSFIAGLSRWATDVQSRIDWAFEKKPDAFSSLLSLDNYLSPRKSDSSAPDETGPDNSSVELRLEQLKRLHDEGLINDGEYGDQRKKILLSM